MPKGYRKPADWGGFAMAIADAQHDEQLAAVKRDDPRVRIPQDAVWAEVKRERDQLRAEVGRLRQILARSDSDEEARLRAENEQLRAALAEMLESFTEPEDDNDILRRARAALVRLNPP